jgi:hypothetical protein
MLHILKSYIKFLWNSTNQHGVHSPFVFDLITKCLYSSVNQQITNSVSFQSKKQKTIHRLLYYFNEPNPQIVTFQNNSNSSSNKVKYIDVNFCVQNKIEIETILSNTTNDTCFIFDNIHKNTSNQAYWKSIIQNPIFTATIDTFQLGITFIRKEQKKQHFTIRN